VTAEGTEWHNTEVAGGVRAQCRLGGEIVPLSTSGEDDMVSPTAKLLGFLILLAAMFTGAYAVGAQVGPIAVSHSSGNGGSMQMGGTGSDPGRASVTGLRR
jgi:hypothetical protein